jgi:Sir2 family
VIHMHGQLNSALCVECGWHGPRYNPLEYDRECAGCGRDALRPDIVLFGEAPRQMRAIEAALRTCDLFLAVGTSGTVYPAAGFVEIAKASGAETHQFNIELPVGSERFDMCHVGNAGELLPKWVGELIDERPVDCGAHSVFYCGPMAEDLRGIGLDAEALTDGSLRLYDQIITPVQPEWGEPGIYAPNVLTAAIEAHGLNIKTEMLGRGFGHEDRLRLLHEYWASN